jgi:hypothetical protein
MTLIASTSLNQAIEQNGPRDPASLLGHVNRSIKQMLGQIERSGCNAWLDDGMDAACFWFEPVNGRLTLRAHGCPCSCCVPMRTLLRCWRERKGVGYVDSEIDFAWLNQEVSLPAARLSL